MNYAVISSGGKQYNVKEGEQLLVEKLSLKKGDQVVFDKVLLYRNEKDILIGQPYVTGVKVIGKIVQEEKGKKIDVIKYKAKVRYRRKIGFRPIYSRVLIESIISDGKKPVEKRITGKLTTVKK